MSVSDPLLKKLKGYILQYRLENKLVDDAEPSLVAFCETLECILRKGLKQSNSIFGLTRRDYWGWIEALTQNQTWLNPKVSMVIGKVQSSKRTTSVIGRGRLFIRIALQHKALLMTLNALFKDEDLVHNWYDPGLSIIGDEILAEIFMSLLHQVEEINFQLDLQNSNFLDDSWILPIYKPYEFVPCKDLGIQVQYVDGRPITIYIRKGGVAEEDGKIEIGDILDELLGECTREMKVGRMTKIMKQNQGYPIPIKVIKCHQADGSIYPPIAILLRKVGKDVASLQKILDDEEKNIQAVKDKAADAKKPAHALLPEDHSDEMPVHSAEEGAIYNVRYLGTISIGPHGGVDQVEGTIGKMLEKLNKEELVAKPVLLELGEKDAVTKSHNGKEVLLTHSYTEISSCGRRTDCVEYFCYIAGETTCTLAKTFVGYVFVANTNEESKTILCTIAQGFNRTHWFV